MVQQGQSTVQSGQIQLQCSCTFQTCPDRREAALFNEVDEYIHYLLLTQPFNVSNLSILLPFLTVGGNRKMIKHKQWTILYFACAITRLDQDFFAQYELRWLRKA